MILTIFAVISSVLCDELSFFLKPKKRFCMHENLAAGDEVSGRVAINPSALYQVRFSINTPSIKAPIYSSITDSEAYAISVTKPGMYHFCFEVILKEAPETNTTGAQPRAASIKETVATCDFGIDVARASSSASVDRYTVTVDQAHKLMSNVQADQRYSKYRENRLIGGLKSVSRRLWIFVIIEIALVVLASGVQMGIITTMHKRNR